MVGEGRPIEAWDSDANSDVIAPECLRVADSAVISRMEVRGVFAGIDTHKDTLAVAVIDAASRLLVSREFPNSDDGFRQLVRLFDTHQVVRVGIEGSGNFGRAVAVHLVLCWQTDRDVVEVPTLMTSRERRGQLGKGKTDPVDALAIARITAREQ